MKKMNLLDKVGNKLAAQLPIKESERMILKRRLNKLSNDPIGFIEGSYKKRTLQIRERLPIKYVGSNSFTVVSAVYNVDKYLDDYFESLIKQSLSFKKHIYLILVDDGSNDESANIIKKWQIKYPKNITYIYKENGGQASARNVGLEYVNTDWVTFIDPDDFLSIDYFLNVDKFIMMDSDLVMISCPLIPYIEDQKLVKDNHPLRYRYKDGGKIKAINNIGKDLQLSASTAIFKSDRIQGARFNEKIKPSFEDAKFVLDFILENYSYKVGYIDNVSYFYRKRSDGTSTLDSAWFNLGLFSTVLEDGVLESLYSAESTLSHIPSSFQITALYHLYWYFNRIINNKTSLEHLTHIEQESFYQLVTNIFEKIDPVTIEKFNLAGAWFFHKVGFLGLFKGVEPSYQIVYIEDYDTVKNQVLISHFTSISSYTEYLLDDIDSIPLYLKEIDYNFIGRKFVTEHRVWVNCNNVNELSVKVNGKKATLSYQGKHLGKINISTIKKDFLRKLNNSNDSWIFIDRNTQADDNAEHLYRYIKIKKLKNNIFFALNKSSNDWDRLEKEGFNLLDFGSEDFEKQLISCDKIISSHIDGYITHYFKDNSLMSKDFVFLQHGVTKDDLSTWLNTKKNLSLFITATEKEYNSICDKNTLYKFTKKETVLTGFPRYDSLIRSNNVDSKNILIMPTWRNNIVGKTITGNHREYNPDFMNTDYARYWHSFVNSDFIRYLAEEQGYSFTFVPHPNIQEYMKVFTLPSYIKIWEYGFGNIQEVFQNSMCLITDYSSVAFDIAYLDKIVFYYQFDSDEVFGGSHTYSKGYYSYDDDGFGPVCKTESELVYKLNEYLNNIDSSLLNFYLERIAKTFAYRDSDNCKRVYERIIQLDNVGKIDFDISVLESFVMEAYRNEVWNLTESRSYLLIDKSDCKKQINSAKEVLVESLIKQNKFSEAIHFLEENFDTNSHFVNYWKAKTFLAVANWNEGISFLNKISDLNEEILFEKINCYAELEDVKTLTNLVKRIDHLSYTQSIMIEAWQLRSRMDWESIVEYLELKLSIFSIEELVTYRPQLLLAQALRNLGNFNKANEYLVLFEKHTKNNSRCRVEIARLAFARGNYEKCINQYYMSVNGDIDLLSPLCELEYIKALLNDNQLQNHNSFILTRLTKYPEMRDLQIVYIQALARNKDWGQLIENVETYNLFSDPSIIYPITLAKYRLGNFEDAYRGISKPNSNHSYDYFSLVVELAYVMEDYELVKYCYKMMIALFPDLDNKKEILEKIRMI